jgi:hypothetical protein
MPHRMGREPHGSSILFCLVLESAREALGESAMESEPPAGSDDAMSDIRPSVASTKKLLCGLSAAPDAMSRACDKDRYVRCG